MKLLLCLTVAAVSIPSVAAELKSGIEYPRAGDTALHLDTSIPDGPGPYPGAIKVTVL